MQTAASEASTVAPVQPSAPWRRTLDDLPGPQGWPLVGNLLQVDVTQAHKTFGRWADEFGLLYHVRLGRRQLLVLADPGLVNEVLHDRPGRFTPPQIMRDAMLDLAIAGVFTS